MAPPDETLDNHAVAAALAELGAMMATQRDNRYRARAYERAARTVEILEDSVAALRAEGRLTAVQGIGPSIAGVITELLGTGTCGALERLRAEFGPGVAELSAVPGMTLPRIKSLYQALGVGSAADLRAACESGLIETVRGFGAATSQKLLENLEGMRTRDDRLLLLTAREVAARLVAHLRGTPDVSVVDVVGSIRRWRETAGNIDLLASGPGTEPGSPAAARALDHFSGFRGVVRRDEISEGHRAVRLSDGVRARLWVVPAAEHAYHLVRLTGSATHVARLGLSPSLRDARSERELYTRLGLPFIPPELREDIGELEAARAGDDFADLVDVGDIRGMTHCHTTFSDGRASVAEMAHAVKARGLDYLTITDHSPSAHYAGGVTTERLLDQWREIDDARRSCGVDILRGTESDILVDGALDYPAEVFERLDIVIASIHTRAKLDRAAMTARLVAAMRAPVFKIWGHPLGRLVGKRPPIDCDVEAVLDAAAASGRAAIEINGDPHRLDLEPWWARAARARGLRFVVSTDAHSIAQLDNLEYGVAMARRAGLRRRDVLNCLAADELREAVRPAPDIARESAVVP